MNDDLVLLLLGIVCAGLGGELFVRGAVGLARWLRIAPGIVGATIAAFATSSPELAVAITAALAGEPQITLGNALGSNVVNIGLILALVLLLSPVHTPRASLRRDFPVALVVPVQTGLLFLDGTLSRLDAMILFIVFAVWLAATVLEARRQRSAAEAVLGEPRHARVVLAVLAGLGLLTAAGELIVNGARGLALAFGMDEFVIGATVVAIGTTVPELATALIAKWRGHDEVGLGTLLGSNIFNGLFIVPVAAAITPITLDARELVVALGMGVAVVALAFPPRDGWLGRGRGGLLLALYLGYLVAILLARELH